MDRFLCLLFPDLEDQIRTFLPGLPQREDFTQDSDENAENYHPTSRDVPISSREDWLADLIREAACAARMGVYPEHFTEIYTRHRRPPRPGRTKIAALAALTDLIDYGYAKNALIWCAPY